MNSTSLFNAILIPAANHSGCCLITPCLPAWRCLIDSCQGAGHARRRPELFTPQTCRSGAVVFVLLVLLRPADSHSNMNRPLQRIASGGRGRGRWGVASSLSFRGASLPPQQRRTLSACSSKKKNPKQNTHANSTNQSKQARHQGKSRRAQPPSAGGRHYTAM